MSLAAAALLASACGPDPDPRLGEEGRVRFGSSGCSNSNTLAVGARVSIHLESATEDPLPGDLGVKSEKPTIISARMDLEPDTIELKAHKQGESRIQVLAKNEPLDALVFSAKPAGQVSHTSVTRAFQGGAVDVIVTSVAGDCSGGEDCPLIGDTFLQWRVEPTTLGSFIADFRSVATFRVTAPGMAQLIGQEPTRSRDLVTQPLEVVATTPAPTLSATLTTIPFDSSVSPVFVTLPGSVQKPDAFGVRVEGVLADSSTVPISRRDVVWRVQGAEIVIEVPATKTDNVFDTPFVVAGTGKVTLVADVAMLAVQQPFEIDLTP